MLEELLIFTRGGLILWSSCRALAGGAALLKGSPIDALIRSCLLEERSGDAGFTKDAYALKWTFNNDLGLVFVAVYQRMLHLLYVDDLLAAVRRDFSQIYNPKRVSYDDLFTETFRQLHLEAEARAEAMKKSRQQPANPSSGGAARGPAGKKLGPNGRPGGGAGGKKNSGSGKDDSDGGDSGKEQNGGFTANGGSVAKGGQENGAVKDTSRAARAVVVDNDGKENGDPNDGAFDVNTLRRKTGGKKGGGGGGGKKNDVKKPAKTEPKKVVKQMRVWDDKPPKNEKLDFTDPADERGEEVIEKVLTNQGDSMMDKDEDLSSDSEDEEEEEEENAGAGQKKKGWFSSMFKSIAGNNVLEKSDLQPALKALKDRLMTKNVG
uniref:Signal recognition particle receptor alpha subunit N-terminal domain-containing protein n=1 Tax=Aegilops tauschii subsp. strangulata TaxID=200361 RepID=A0A453J991_AEGTS